MSTYEPVAIDHERTASRIAADVDALAGPEYTLASDAICRYAYTPVYRATLD